MRLYSPRSLTRHPLVLACRVLSALLATVTACTPDRSSHTDADTVAVVRDTTGTVPVSLTALYVKLLRAQLTAEDPYQAGVAIHCEQLRIMRVMSQRAASPLEGENAAVESLRAAGKRAFTPADQPARDRVDRALHGRVFTAELGCDSLAKAGMLGDTVWPEFKKWTEAEGTGL
jgi:hypothetical protein